MEYSESSLGKILRNMYDCAPKGYQSTMVHIFGIKYGRVIKQNRFDIKMIVKYSGISSAYHTEVSKGVKLGDWVQVMPSRANELNDDIELI